MKKTRNYAMAVAVGLLPVLRFLDRYYHGLFTLLSVTVCLFFLLRGIYYHLLESRKGRSFLRRIPFLRVPEE